MELTPIFEIKMNEIFALRKWFLDKPREMRRCTATILNNYAFGTREQLLRVLPELMTIRNAGLVRKTLWADKANYGDPIEAQQSHAGTRLAGLQRFTGWVEQEDGTKAKRTRLQTRAARGGSFANEVQSANRLRPGNHVLRIAEYNPRGGLSNIGGFTAMVKRKKYAGLYMIENKILRGGRLIQKIRPQKGLQPRKKPFLLYSAGRYHGSIDLSLMWYRTVERVLTPPPRG